VIAPAHHNLEPVTAEPVLAATMNGWAGFDSLLPVPPSSLAGSDPFVFLGR
jgi:hypothetical protein